jgi:hypothetical protein
MTASSNSAKVMSTLAIALPKGIEKSIGGRPSA